MDAWAELMSCLGYERFGAQGGDWGSMVTAALAVQHPERVTGIHLTLAVVVPPAATLADLTPAEQATLDGFAHYQRWDGGYSAQQSSWPQTLGYSLADSPMGQAAWIIEKFWSWTDNDGHPEDVVDRDTLLDNVMLYWLTNTATSSARLYWESFHDLDARPITVPVGASIYPGEIFRPSRPLVRAALRRPPRLRRARTRWALRRHGAAGIVRGRGPGGVRFDALSPDGPQPAAISRAQW